METVNNNSYLLINENDKSMFNLVNENVVNDSRNRVFYSLFILNKKITEEINDGTKIYDGVNISAIIWKFILNENDSIKISKALKNYKVIDDFKHIYSTLIIIVIAAGVAILGGYLNTLTWGKSNSGDIGETWKFIIWKGGTLLLGGAGAVYALFSVYLFFKTLFSFIFLPITNSSTTKKISEKKFKNISKLISEFMFFQLKENYQFESNGNIIEYKYYTKLKEKYKSIYKLPDKYEIEYKRKRSDSKISYDFKYKLYYISSDVDQIFKNIPSDIKKSQHNSKILICNGIENIILPVDIINELK